MTCTLIKQTLLSHEPLKFVSKVALLHRFRCKVCVCVCMCVCEGGGGGGKEARSKDTKPLSAEQHPT